MMRYEDVKVLVTGGAGFIGSHLVDALMRRGADTTVLDNLSHGTKNNVARWLGHPNFTFITGDCLEPRDVRRAINGCKIVLHLAANPEVRIGAVDTRVDFEQNIIATYTLLEEIRRSEKAKTVAFTSTSTVYGEAELLPTPEDYGPLKPISLYGGSKLACEALISAYCHMFSMRGVIFRFANIVGSRSRHGVIYDFIQKLTENPGELEILGDGRQTKSYLLVEDCVDALLFGLEHAKERVEIFNTGPEDQIDVTTIAKVVSEEMGLQDVEFRYTGGVEGGRGWIGDVKVMLLDISKLKKLGWRPEHNSSESIRTATTHLLKELRYKW